VTAPGAPTTARVRGRPPQAVGAETRERILEAALDLFGAHGYDKTSLREIAERVKVTKAALYYYFPSKQEILAALADRLFDSAETAFDPIERAGFSMGSWRIALGTLVDKMLSQQKVFALLERNRTVLEQLQADDERFASHRRLHEFVDGIVRDPSVPLEDRVRFACSIGAVMGVVLGMHDGFPDVSADELRPIVLDVLRDLLHLDA
jgi:AcrR family transcriptional regulator